MEKIVVLNSGGFDSLVMIHALSKHSEEVELHSLYFSYGQLSDELAKAKSKEIADKYCKTHTVIELPCINWSKNEFFKHNPNSDSNRYLEARNLIFLSYAVSFCQGMNYDSITMALIKDSIHHYADTSKAFVKKMASLCKEFGISFTAPTINLYKDELTSYAVNEGITEDDFISCDMPVNNKRCGKCPDCKSTDFFNAVREEYLKMKNKSTPIDLK